MSLFYAASSKEIVQIRNKIFIEIGIPALNKNGFRRSPFSKADFGWHPSLGHFYQLCRLSSDGIFLEFIDVHIIHKDKWIQIHLNIFKLDPKAASLDQLNGLDGLQFNLPPNSITRMRLHVDDIKGIPLFSYDFMSSKHKLKSYFTMSGLKRRAHELSECIEKDLSNIDYFINRWHELHKPIVTTWQGEIEGFDGMTVNERLFASGLMSEFDIAQKRDKERAKQILRWLKVDELSIGNIIK